MLLCLLIAAMSIVVYSQKYRISVTTWCPEVFGFIWGIALADCKGQFAKIIEKKWIVWSVALCLVAGVLGLAYLKLKPVPIYGDYILKIVLGLAITVFILAVNVKIEFGNKASLFLGEISYEVYLLHGVVFGLIAYLLPEINSGMFIVLSIAVTVTLSWIVSAVSKTIIGGINKTLIKSN